MKTGKESQILIRAISDFLGTYAGTHLTESKDTLKSYHSTMRKYLGFLEDQKGITTQTINKACFERNVIEEWLRFMKDTENLSPDTCNIRLGGLRTFLKYLGSRSMEFTYLYTDAVDIPLMKTEKKKIQGLTKQAVKTIMAEPDQATKTGRRDLVFMIIAYGTAARMAEILSIRIKHICLDRNKPSITIVGKGNKIRTLYLLPKAVAHIRKYIKEAHGDDPNPEDYLIYSRNGSSRNKLSSKAIEKRLRLYAGRAHEKCHDVPLDLHAHQFRHARATHWLEEGINIVEISTLLGHEQLATTMRYLDISSEEQLKALATLEDENDSKVSRKWNTKGNSLKNLVK